MTIFMTGFSEWQKARDSNKLSIRRACPNCGMYYAYLMKRFCLDDEGHRGDAQFHYECTNCGRVGKTYFNQNVARMSWDGEEGFS